MATVDGVTVAEADRIDKKHFASMDVAGSTLSLTRENGSVLSAALPAGGEAGPLSVSYFQTPTVVQSAFGTGRAAYFDEWDELIRYGDSIGLNSPAGTSAWDYDEAGWYQIAFQFWLGFNVGTTALPSHAQATFSSWEGVTAKTEIPLSAAPGLVLNRTSYGGLAVMTTVPYYSPGAAEASAGDGANSISLLWPGDAVLTTGNGGVANVGHAVTMQIARLA